MEEIKKAERFEEKHGSSTLSCLIFKSYRKAMTKGKNLLEVLLKEIEEHERN